MTIKDRIFDFAQCLIDSSGGELVMAFNEQDTTTQTDKEAAHFLKYKSKRLGRDLELYSFMDEIMGTPSLLAHLLEEILLPGREAASWPIDPRAENRSARCRAANRVAAERTNLGTAPTPTAARNTILASRR